MCAWYCMRLYETEKWGLSKIQNTGYIWLQIFSTGFFYILSIAIITVTKLTELNQLRVPYRCSLTFLAGWNFWGVQVFISALHTGEVLQTLNLNFFSAELVLNVLSLSPFLGIKSSRIDVQRRRSQGTQLSFVQVRSNSNVSGVRGI